MHDKKQQDYGSNTDPFANVRASESLGIPAWVGAVLRNNDKQVRLNKAAADTMAHGYPALANEGVKDSLLDQAVYALIAYVLYEEWDAEGSYPDEQQGQLFDIRDYIETNFGAGPLWNAFTAQGL